MSFVTKENSIAAWHDIYAYDSCDQLHKINTMRLWCKQPTESVKSTTHQAQARFLVCAEASDKAVSSLTN